VPEEPDDLSAADEALRALREELRVAPSADFQARVRARIEQPREPALRWVWLVPAAVAVLLIGVAAWLLAPRTNGPAVAVESPAPAPVVTATPLAPPTSVTPAPVRPSPVRTTRRARPLAEPIRPLVEPGEEARIARYVASVRHRPLDAETLAESDPHRPLVEPAPIELDPLDTAPLVPDEGSPR
jgi:hypothetical protein